jgi:hypothetical protein
MSTSAILISTVLLVLAVLAVALLAGALALLAGRQDPARQRRGGLAESLTALDRQWHIERLIYRHHRSFGLLVVTAAGFCLWQLTRSSAAEILAAPGTTSILLWFLVASQILNLLIGLVLLLRPSLLKPMEAVGNRWHRLDINRERHPQSIRITAALLALVGLTVLVGSAALLLQQLNAAVQ